ncbi:MAG: ribulose-phosphate 3-epimerase, partial [Candidatus Omnitrophota bacterium]
VLGLIRSCSVTRGVSLRPQTPVAAIEKNLKDVDLVLLMTVNPGFGGQAFMPEVMPKVRELRARFDKDIQVDGGINKDTCRAAVEAGANVLVAGTAIFGRKDTRQAIEDLRCHR